MMKRVVVLFWLVAVFVASFYSIPVDTTSNSPQFLEEVFAVEGCASDDLNCIESTINEYKKKISELQGQQKNLQTTVSLLDRQVQLKQGEISKTTAEILVLEKEIRALEQRIDGLEISLEKLTKVLIDRVQASYKATAKGSPFQAILRSEFEDSVAIYKFSQLSRDYTRALMSQAELQRLNYDEEKVLKQEKQLSVEKLQLQLESQRSELQQQQRQQRSLLEDTKNNEQRFQSLLNQALSEKNALEAALVSGTKVGSVKRGDPIALVGNTGYPGCSTGEHLHLELRKDDRWVNPGQYLQSKSVLDLTNGGSITLGSGSWEWPLQDTIRLTQNYGVTPYSWRYKYSGGIHTGYDMVSTSSKVIRAPADGEMYTSTQSCGAGSSPIKIVYLDHGDNVISFYLHVQ